MKEVKSPRKPLIYYYGIVLLILRQAPKYASILLREPSCSELSDCLITLSEQTQAQRLRATFSFCRSVTE